jgi:hypothetical protein
LSHTDVDYRDALLFPPAEASPEITDFNALVKQSAETLLPLLGDQICLRLFSSYGLFPVALRASQIEGILSRLFTYAKEEMESGHTVFIGTAEFRVPRHDYSNPQQEIPTHVALTFRYTEVTNESLQNAIPSCVSSGAKTTRLRDMLQDLNGFIAESMGFLSLDQFYPYTVVRIYFPVVNQSGMAVCPKPFAAYPPPGRDRLPSNIPPSEPT